MALLGDAVRESAGGSEHWRCLEVGILEVVKLSSAGRGSPTRHLFWISETLPDTSRLDLIFT